MRYKKPTHVLSTSDLYALDKELERYHKERYSRHARGTVVTMDTKQWLIDKKAITPAGAIIITNYTHATFHDSGRIDAPRDCDPIMYETCMHDLEQWYKWKGKKKYAQEKMDEHLDKVAETLGDLTRNDEYVV